MGVVKIDRLWVLFEEVIEWVVAVGKDKELENFSEEGERIFGSWLWEGD